MSRRVCPTSPRWVLTSSTCRRFIPSGRQFRKGKNNATEAEADDVGSPWGIGSEEGGHKAIHPQLGTFEDFSRLVERGQAAGH